MTATRLSRRTALRRATIAGGALAAPALLAAPAFAQEDAGEDALEAFLAEAVVIEQIGVLAYETAAGLPDSEGALATTLQGFAAHEQTHATALRTALDSLGADLPPAPATLEDTAAVEEAPGLDSERAAELADLLTELAGIGEREAMLDYLIDLERRQIDLYVEAAPRFAAEDVVRVCAEIAGCEAQHAVVLREALGASPREAAAGLVPAPQPPDA